MHPSHFGEAFGWVAEEAVDYSRERIAQLIGVESKEIIFTSGATEADNLALKGVFERYRSKMMKSRKTNPNFFLNFFFSASPNRNSQIV